MSVCFDGRIRSFIYWRRSLVVLAVIFSEIFFLLRNSGIWVFLTVTMKHPFSLDRPWLALTSKDLLAVNKIFYFLCYSVSRENI